MRDDSSLKKCLTKLLIISKVSSLVGGRAIITRMALAMATFLLFSAAKAALPLQMKLELGFEGRYRIGSWTPLRVLFENQGPSVKGTLMVKLPQKPYFEKASAETVYSLPISLPSSSRKLYQINVLLESNIDSLEVLLVSNEKTLIKKKIELEPFYQKNGFILVVNRSHSGFSFLNLRPTQKIRRVIYADLDELPNEWIGYDAIRALILDDITSVELTSFQQRAIKIWLSTGGTLILTARGGYGKFKTPFLLNLLPLEFLEKIHLESSFSSLQDKYGAFDRGIQRVEVWNSRWQKGDILMKEGNIPLVIRLDIDQGRVFFLTFDFFQPSFKNWSGLPHLWADLLKEEDSLLPISWGIGDFIAASSFPWQGKLWPGRGGIVVFLLVYLLFVGFFCWQGTNRRLFRRTEIGLALTILGFIGISYLLGLKIRENNTLLRQVSICYQRQDGFLARTESYNVFFSPASRPVELKFNEKNSFVSALLAPRHPRLLRDLVVHLEAGKIHWSSPFSPPWSFHLFRSETILPFSLEAKINAQKEVIGVSLKNLNPFSLEDLLLLYDGHSAFLKELAPSGETDLTLNLKEKDSSFSSSKYLQEVMLRSPDSEAKLRREIFQQMWDFEGPLKELTTRFCVLLAWFEDSPQIVPAADGQGRNSLTGLLIMPLKIPQSEL